MMSLPFCCVSYYYEYPERANNWFVCINFCKSYTRFEYLSPFQSGSGVCNNTDKDEILLATHCDPVSLQENVCTGRVQMRLMR